MIKTGIHFWFGYPIENRQRFKIIKEAGFDAVMIWWGDEYAAIDGGKDCLPLMAREAGLEIANVHVPYEQSNDIWLEGVEAATTIEMYRQCILACVRHNIPTMVMHPSRGNAPPLTPLGLDRIKSLVDLAEQKNVNIAFENLRRTEYLDYILSNIQSKNLGFCYDSGHENCYSKGTDFLNDYGHRLMALHLHDNDEMDDQHRLPGEGTINWPTVVNKIKVSSYSGPITLEVTKEFSEFSSDLSAEEFLKTAHSKARALFL